MLFPTYLFMLVFLPVVWIGYFALAKILHARVALFWLTLASLFFYSVWNPIYLPLILVSILGNFLFAHILLRSNLYRITTATVGIAANLLLLGYFKYTNFFIDNVNALSHLSFPNPHIVLPLAISFFTFQQIAYLVDCYKDQGKAYSLFDYTLFVTFFPQLIAGPIVHHKEMMPQFTIRPISPNFHNIALGLFVFAVGLVKKTVIADTLAPLANAGFAATTPLTAVEAWASTLAYTFQIYFDFSGYTDMAIGIALLFNIVLPINFNSPYKATSIQDFWHRWHITLSRFLRDYIYIPLGGSKRGEGAMYRSILIVFLLGGLWHGAAWTFVIWGALHGCALVVNHLWRKTNLQMSQLMGWIVTMLFVIATWVPFRAESVAGTLSMWKSLLFLNGFSVSDKLIPHLPQWLLPYMQFEGFMPELDRFYQIDIVLICLSFIALIAVVKLAPNSNVWRERFSTNMLYLLATLLLFMAGLYATNGVTEFLYFNF